MVSQETCRHRTAGDSPSSDSIPGAWASRSSCLATTWQPGREHGHTAGDKMKSVTVGQDGVSFSVMVGQDGVSHNFMQQLTQFFVKAKGMPLHKGWSMLSIGCKNSLAPLNLISFRTRISLMTYGLFPGFWPSSSEWQSGTGAHVRPLIFIIF